MNKKKELLISYELIKYRKNGEDKEFYVFYTLVNGIKINLKVSDFTGQQIILKYLQNDLKIN